ncbi:TetR/AcrR family transcriptional regulator [Bacillus sp. DJP31]|uniref:TetR/AcrR family transcriptional regulator n=1 Tax=Bacillus sp. DJP31 TaxID=3409789 RepID=UPI003BB80745
MELKRNKIVEQAIILFSDQGYNDTTIAKVAKAAGVSFGSVFTYFPSKEVLFHHAVVEPLLEYSSVLLDFNPDADNPSLEIEKMITNHICLFSRLSTYLRLLVQVIGQRNRFESQFKEINILHDKLVEKITSLVLKGQQMNHLRIQDPMIVATSYMSLLMGLRLNLSDEPNLDFWFKFVPYAKQLFGPKI